MKNFVKQKQIYHTSIYKELLIITKEIFVCLLIIFIFVFCYYICIYTYNLSNYNNQLTIVCTINIEELKPVNQSNIWYKYLLDDFFNKFTHNGKTINYKIIEVKSEVKTLIPLELKQDISTVKKPVILNKIQSDHIKVLYLSVNFTKIKLIY